MISQTETAGGAGQYGFYAVPKALEPRKKYRDHLEDEEQQQQDEDFNPFAQLNSHEPINERELQRDYYVDEAPYPQFRPRERGLDFGVQIERGELFDFDLEVRPLVEIMVGRSVVSALNELQEEGEKEQRRDDLDKYQKKRNAELMVTQRLDAKHKRKLEEAQRRKLQKQVFVKRQKEVGSKLLARKNAKQSLLGFKNELFDELQESGFLRSEPEGDLKINFEEWLYAKIMDSLAGQRAGQNAAERLVKESQDLLAEQHRKAIAEEIARRKVILDERERVRRDNEDRKEKKRYRKLRQRLNAQRQPQFARFQQFLEKYDQVNSIIKYGERSNGFSKNFAGKQSLYIAGGLDNFLLALLESTGREWTAQEIENLLTRVIAESGREIEINLLGGSYDKVQQTKKRLEESKAQFMGEKKGEVKDLAQQIALDLSLLEAAATPIRSSLHYAFVEAVLAIYLTAQPEKTQQNGFELEEADRRRLEIADRIIFCRQNQTFLQRMQTVNEILRVRFEVVHTVSHSQASQKKEELAQEQWVDIFDGEGWQRYRKGGREVNKSEQVAASFGLGAFQNSFVYDERILHYLQAEIEKIGQLAGGEGLKRYVQGLGNMRARVKKDLPVYDGEIRWK